MTALPKGMSYKISVKNHEKQQEKKICELVPELLNRYVPSTFGYFSLQDAFLDCRRILQYENFFQKSLEKEQWLELKKGCESEIVEGFEDVGLYTYDLRPVMSYDEIANKIILPYPQIVKKCLVHLFFFTKNLLNVEGGKLDDPDRNDGLSHDIVESAKFQEAIKYLRYWETDGLWEAVWAPFGGQPSDEEEDKIPEEKFPFQFDELYWRWNWVNKKEEDIFGYCCEITDLPVYSTETLWQLEARIDRAINPIKKFLSRETPSNEEQFVDVDV